MGVKLGPINAVVLSSYKPVREYVEQALSFLTI